MGLSKWYNFHQKFLITTGSHHEKNTCHIRGSGRPLRIPAWAKTYYVDAKYGSDYNTGLKESQALKTIQAAIDKAAGSTIFVAPGTYAPIDSRGKKLTIKAMEDFGSTIIDGDLSDEEIPIGARLGKWGTQTEYGTWKNEAVISVTENSTGKTTKFSIKYVNSSSEERVTTLLLAKGWYFQPYENDKEGSRSGIIYSKKPPQVYLDGDYGAYQESWEINANKQKVSFYKYQKWCPTSDATLVGIGVTRCAKPVQGGCLSYCSISGNETDSYFDGMVCKSKLEDCIIENNHCGNFIVIDSTLTRCVVAGNYAGYFVVYCYNGKVSNSLLIGNTGNSIIADTPVYNTTIVDNQCYSSVEQCNVYNCIVWGNRDNSGDAANIYASNYMNGEYQKASYSMMNSLVEDVLVIQFGNKGKSACNSTGNISGDPCFIDPEHGDYHLAPWSPCIDMGADYQSKTGKFDLDSAARKVGKVDMGVYELQPRMAVPADYDGDGITDAAFYFAASGQWWVFKSSDGKIRAVSLPDANGTPCPADYDGDGCAEPAYYTAAAKTPEFVRVNASGKAIRKTFGEKGATPVAARLAGGKATFGAYTANAKKPTFSFLDSPLKVEFGAKASRPVVEDFDNDGSDDLGVYTATASKPAFSILQSSRSYSPSALFNGGAVALGPKGAIPCCADYDGKGGADFGVYMSNTKEPYFQRLFSSSKFRETRTLPMGSKGDVPVVGIYEAGKPAAPAIWTGSVWTYLGSDWEGRGLVGE
ncbi:MAG: hypothetical protein ILM98_05170 [Kiritimatiellae bacterium]|nr:hypothetical protein [Kiritimatiellia bacterium]